MALSPKTVEYIEEAKSALRNAIFHAARNERTHTIQALAEVLSQIDKLACMDDVLDSLDSLKDKWDKKHDLD
jgi:hypothetical protein